MNRKMMAAACTLFLAGAAFAQNMRSNTAAPAARVVQQDTTTVYDVSTTNKKGTTQYGMVEQTRTTPQGGTQIISQTRYSDYTPSRMALANAHHAEISVAGGGSYLYNKDSEGKRFGKTGLSGSAQILWDVNENLGLGIDYMYLSPNSREHGDYKYKNIRLNSIAFAGKYTINAWDKLSLYVPMGVGAAQARMKSSGTRGGVYSADSQNKWGVDLFAGLGLQYNLSSSLFVGLEYRYTYAFIKSDELNRYYGKNQNLQFHSGFLRLGMRF